MATGSEIANYWEGHRKGEKKERERIVGVIERKRNISDEAKEKVIKSI